MAGDGSQMAGQVHTKLRPRALAARLKTAGLNVQVRESCQYKGGCYIRLHEGAYFTLERVEASEYLAHADADSVEQMRTTAGRVSRALAELDIRHRFEVYDEQSRLAHYLHHLWPETTSV